MPAQLCPGGSCIPLPTLQPWGQGEPRLPPSSMTFPLLSRAGGTRLHSSPRQCHQDPPSCGTWEEPLEPGPPHPLLPCPAFSPSPPSPLLASNKRLQHPQGLCLSVGPLGGVRGEDREVEALQEGPEDPLVSWVPVVCVSVRWAWGSGEKQVLAALPEVPGGLCRSDAHKLRFGWS